VAIPEADMLALAVGSEERARRSLAYGQDVAVHACPFAKKVDMTNPLEYFTEKIVPHLDA
jgi:hypothetical protein